jgi:hypothetical protein
MKYKMITFKWDNLNYIGYIELSEVYKNSDRLTKMDCLKDILHILTKEYNSLFSDGIK